jgi:hypothetical protein
MKNIRRTDEQQEPIGIVISRGTREEAAPKFWAYIWAPAPEGIEAESEPRVA